VPEKMANKFLGSIISSIKKRMKKINYCAELKKEAKGTITNLITLKQGFLDLSTNFKAASFVKEMNTLEQYARTVDKVSYQLKCSITKVA
jgi:hypothetical protein